MAKPPPVEAKYYLETTPDKVFDAISNPETLTKWFLSSAKIKPVKGSTYTFKWQGGFTHKGKVKKATKNKSLALTWPDEFKGKTFETEVEFTLRPKGKGTVLKVRHTGFKKGDDWLWLYGAIQSGWAYYLMNLKSLLGQGVDLRSEHDEP